MLIENLITRKAECIRVFTFELIAGKEAEYRHYLTNIVEVIDHNAHQKGIFLEVLNLYNDNIEKQRVFQRVFLFENKQQRNDFASNMAQSAMAFDGSQQAQNKRKQYVNTLRVQLTVNDYTFF